jgi:Tfp pilus assembly PilM family ATPase
LARFLALDWDHQQLRVVAATLRGGRVHIERAAAWTEEQSPNPAEAESLGRLLRERLKSAGIPLAPMLACVSRDRVILKEVRYPAVPEHEEPAVVQFQVSKELTDALDEVVIDYAAAQPAGGDGEKQAAALVIRRELLNTYETLCQTAGLKLTALTPASFGMLACWKQVVRTARQAPAPVDAAAAAAILTVEEHAAEFCIVHGDQLLLSRSLAAGTTLPAEVRRTLAVYAAQSPRHPVGAVYVAGGEEHAPFRARLHDLLGIPVHAMDPFAGTERPEIPPDNRGGFVSAVGLLFARAGRVELPVNFVQPKRPKPPRDPNKRRLLAAACVAAVLLLGAVAYGYNEISAKQLLLDNANLKKQKLDNDLARLQEDYDRIRQLEEWNNDGIVWLDELYDLTQRFPDTESVRLISLTGEPVTHSVQNKRTTKPARTGSGSEEEDRSVAKLSLSGVARSDDLAIDQLNQRFVEDRHYHVSPKQTSSNTGADKALFPQQFAAHVKIEKIAPDKYTRRLDVVADEGFGNERNGGRRRGRRLGFERGR